MIQDYLSFCFFILTLDIHCTVDLRVLNRISLEVPFVAPHFAVIGAPYPNDNSHLNDKFSHYLSLIVSIK